MEVNNSQFDDGDFCEYIGGGIGTKEPEKKKRKRQTNQDPADMENRNLSDHSFDIHAELAKIHEKLNNQSEEMGTMKSERQLLEAKVDLLEAQNGELLARLETMERKLKVAELEAKMAKQEMHNFVAEKVNEETGQLREKLRKAKRKMQEDRLKFNELEAKLERKVNKLEAELKMVAKQLVQGMAESRGKMAALENGLFTVRAQKPISCEFFALNRGLKSVYFEVSMKNKRLSVIGWIDANFPLNLDGKAIGDHPGSFVITCSGNYCGPDHRVQGYSNGFVVGDVVGTGFTRDGKIFFTKNGRLNGEPILLDIQQDQLLFPAVSLFCKDTLVEANFGANPAKPFIFDIDAHEEQLFA